MDPLSCLSVAGAAVQFVDFGIKIVSASHQLYKDSKLTGHEEISRATRDLVNFSEKLQQSTRTVGVSSCLTEDEAQLESVCQGCFEVANTLRAKLDRLSVSGNGKGRVWQSLKSALLSIWSANEIAAIEDRLLKYQVALNSQLLNRLSRRISLLEVQQSTRFDDLDERTKQLMSYLLNIESSMTNTLYAQTKAIAQLLSRTEVLVKGYQDITRTRYVGVFQAGAEQQCTIEQEAFFGKMKMEEEKICNSVTDCILDSLRYPERTARYEEVAEAHKKTFEWVFRDSEASVKARKTKPWSNFSDWLEHGDGIYWVNGKAGSGKSTLMKYIFNHPDTHRYLSNWAHGSTLHVAGFFFWLSGTPKQRSQVGLLRSLLYDILRQMPELAPLVLPEQWAAIYSSKVQLLKTNHSEPWLLSTLQHAFKTLAHQQVVPMKLCLFIDGLDEYEGDDLDMAILFKKASESSNVKICVSSRPHIVFEDAFFNRPGLRLQDLSAPDIRQFIYDQLADDERFQRLRDEEPVQTPKLIDEIVMAANGVFLWVKLVVTSLLEGLGLHDHVSDLELRLRALPPELEDLYAYMVLKVHKTYQQEAARLFQLVAEAGDSRVDDWIEASPLTVLGLSLAVEKDPDLALTAPPHFLTRSQILSRCKAMGSRLKSRCGGLLEIQFGQADSSQVEPNMKVTYLHRTVKDYLSSDETRGILVRRTSGIAASVFKPSLAILKSHILQLKALEADDPQNWALINGTIKWALRTEQDTQIGYPKLLDEFWRIASPWMRDCKDSPFFRQQTCMLTLAAQAGLYQYLSCKLMEDENLVRKLYNNRPLLDWALVPCEGVERWVSADVVSILLDHGADPNKCDGKWSPWQNALSYLHVEYLRFPKGDIDRGHILMRWADVIKVLLQRGAAIEVECRGPPRYENIDGKLAKSKKMWLPGEVIERRYIYYPHLLRELRPLLQKKPNTVERTHQEPQRRRSLQEGPRSPEQKKVQPLLQVPMEKSKRPRSLGPSSCRQQ